MNINYENIFNHICEEFQSEFYLRSHHIIPKSRIPTIEKLIKQTNSKKCINPIFSMKDNVSEKVDDDTERKLNLKQGDTFLRFYFYCSCSKNCTKRIVVNHHHKKNPTYQNYGSDPKFFTPSHSKLPLHPVIKDIVKGSLNQPVSEILNTIENKRKFWNIDSNDGRFNICSK